MSTITLIVAKVAWTERLTRQFITEARVNRSPQPWGYMRHMGKGMWKVLAIFQKAIYMTSGQSLEIPVNLQSWMDCILLTDTHTLETAKAIITEAGHQVDVVKYQGLLRSG